MNEIEKFKQEVADNIERMYEDEEFVRKSLEWQIESCKYKYSYNFTWMGRPIIQYPQDMIAMQELIWKVKPDIIIEAGIAHGGSLIFYASMLELIGHGRVIGIDIDIRKHNRKEIEEHKMFSRITMLEGSSTSEEIVKQVAEMISGEKKVMVVLDSNHTYDHVMKELECYSGFVTKDSYLVVMDTIIEDVPEDLFLDRPWGKGDNPKVAVRDFLQKNKRFEIDKTIEKKLLITVAPSGYLHCVE